MRTLGRVLTILAVFALVMGITYFAVNAGGTSTNGALPFENGGRQFPANGQFQPGQRPEGNFEGRREGGEHGSGGWMFGLIKNVGIIAVVTVLIALPRNMARNRKRTMPVAVE